MKYLPKAALVLNLIALTLAFLGSGSDEEVRPLLFVLVLGGMLMAVIGIVLRERGRSTK